MTTLTQGTAIDQLIVETKSKNYLEKVINGGEKLDLWEYKEYKIVLFETEEKIKELTNHIKNNINYFNHLIKEEIKILTARSVVDKKYLINIELLNETYKKINS